MIRHEKLKMVDYVVDGGEGQEELYDTKRDALRRAQKLANERQETINVYRWARPDRWSDLELDEGGIIEVQPQA